ncbi:peptidyl-tRNA hydrolase 2, mitochondrial-like isoform X2 [Salvelinus fontinalis]|uniref:peptidyl-tRNA hydrolase 2, mitochondrial-like isoform X2 n=2 Tax=Salvelinus fontinalis TaxID=8038 RepID=UPI002485C4A3|nr:peptidyl-tRNA hydrolase 2, mitochondrial-like isoform X2 [Salvelinus fontinalis]
MAIPWRDSFPSRMTTPPQRVLLGSFNVVLLFCSLCLLQLTMEPSDQQTGPDSGSQEVNPVYLQQLRELDIPEEAAKQALLHTRNVSAEEAAMYYFNKLENEEGDDDLMFKMVFVVNMDLAMGVGKVAAQVGHAAVGLYQALQEKNSWREMAWKWDHGGAKKVVLQGTNMAHLLELQALAMSLSLPTYLVQDAGRTQVEAGSRTILAIVGEEDMVNNVTGSLKLL